MKKVLIVMPTYNSMTTIEEAIDSILAQSHTNWQLIIVDDCSNDKTIKLIKPYLNDSRISLYQNSENQGAYYSRNAGLYLAKDMSWDYFTTHDSDDISYPDRIERMVKEMMKAKVNAVKDAFRRIKFSNKREIGKASVTSAHAMFDRRLLNEIGYFETVRFGADWEYWDRVERRNKFTRLNKTATIRDTLGDSYILQNNLTVQIPVGSDLRMQYINETQELHELMQFNNNFYMPFRFKKSITKSADIIVSDKKMFNLKSNQNKNKIAVVLLTWQRINLLSNTLRGLSLQTRSDFTLHISNGNDKYKTVIDETAKKFESSLDIEVSHDGNASFSFRRLTAAKKLAERGYETIIFLDDDITFPATYVQEMMNHYEPKSYKSAYSWTFQNGGADYYKYRTRITDNSKSPDYCGTGLAVIDASIFLDKKLFNAPKEAYKIEDLWLSYYIKNVKKWKMSHVKLSSFTIGGVDRHALHKTIINNKVKDKDETDKADFLRMLVKDYGWKL